MKQSDVRVTTRPIQPMDLMVGPRARGTDPQAAVAEGLPRRRLAQLLVALRRRAGRTQRQMAEALEVSPSRVSRIEAATTPWPKAQTIARYAGLCGLSLGYLFFRWDRKQAGRIFPLDPAVYDDAETAEERAQLERTLPAGVRGEGVEALWRETLPRRRLAQQLVRMRASAGLTQKEMAARLDLDPAELSRMESGLEPWPKAERLQRYAQALGWQVGFIFLEAGTKTRRGWILPLAEPVKTLLHIGGARRPAEIRPRGAVWTQLLAELLPGADSGAIAAGALPPCLLKSELMSGRSQPPVQAFLPQLFEQARGRAGGGAKRS